ncbi:MAG: hypothetical protein PHD82_16930, partial [Candidatus Riflebacteria bacterium]|nr:hypothetical protein [Candidatus Riflebacteria bacterium]
VAADIGSASGMLFSPDDVLASAMPMHAIAIFSLALLALVMVIYLIKMKFFSAGDIDGRCTWDCGFAVPDSRIQYTSSSFSQPAEEVFSSIVRPYRHGEKVGGLFPQHASFRTDSPDSLLRYLFIPLFTSVDRLMVPLRALQHGRLHLYICYIAIVLLALLIWKVVAA